MAWEIDPSHSEVLFSIKHAMVTTVRGHFNVMRGSLHIDEVHPENSWVDAEAETASIDTRDERRDGHLRSPDFFDAQNYPTIAFKSTKVEPRGDNEYNVYGDLSMHGVTKPVVFKAEYNGQQKDAFGMQRSGLSATTKINREEWGLSWNAALEAGGFLVSKDVKIEIDLSAINKAPATQAESGEAVGSSQSR